MTRRTVKPILGVLCLTLVACLLVGAGCNEDANRETERAVTTVSEEPEADGAELVAVGLCVPAAAGRTFAFDLYRALRTEPGNLFVSPYSVFAALAMTLAGARGVTAAQIAATLRWDADPDALGAAFAALDETLSARGTPAAPYEGEGFAFHVVNAMWTQAGFPLLESFVAALETDYRAGLRELDFARDPSAARRTINDWVAEQTANRIVDLIPEGAIDTLTRLVLTNAIYFNAPWLHPFDPERTTTESFALLDGGRVDVSMMHTTESLLYAAWDGGVAFELPYNGNELAMIVLVPDEGTFDAFDAALTVEIFDGVVASLASRSIALGFPRFTFVYAASLVDPLTALGMTDAFDGARADFSGITGERDLVVSDVLHKAFVAVDEAGTEAAAATAVVFRGTGMPIEPVVVTVDRPFLFVVRDRPTGSVLFVGRVVSPQPPQ